MFCRHGHCHEPLVARKYNNNTPEQHHPSNITQVTRPEWQDSNPRPQILRIPLHPLRLNIAFVNKQREHDFGAILFYMFHWQSLFKTVDRGLKGTAKTLSCLSQSIMCNCDLPFVLLQLTLGGPLVPAGLTHPSERLTSSVFLSRWPTMDEHKNKLSQNKIK